MTIYGNTAVLDEEVVVESPVCGPTDRRDWYVIYVKSRQDFTTASELVKKGIPVFIPTFKKLSQWTDRKKLIEYPMFPGYVFVQVPAAPGAFLDVLKTRGVVSFVSLEPGTPTPVNQAELTALRLLIESGRKIDVRPELGEGTRVRLRSGALVDACGILSKKENELMFVVNIELLGRSVAVRVSSRDIEAA